MKPKETKKHMNTENSIPIVEINDPYEFVSSSTPIAYLAIKGKVDRTIRVLMRTTKGGYVTQ